MQILTLPSDDGHTTTVRKNTMPTTHVGRSNPEGTIVKGKTLENCTSYCSCPAQLASMEHRKQRAKPITAYQTQYMSSCKENYDTNDKACSRGLYTSPVPERLGIMVKNSSGAKKEHFAQATSWPLQHVWQYILY